MFRVGKWLIAAFVVMSVHVNLVMADAVDTMEKALMPGELSEAHKKFEDKCTECHKFFKQSKQTVLCLDCHDHEKVAKDIKEKRGYHGRIPGITERECNVCHHEHLGRKADILFLDKQTFKHDDTDFVLRGGHKNLRCDACHEKGKKYREAKGACFDCHKKIDPHKERLGKLCDSCHRESSWRDFQYDHSRTDFPLEGKHKGVECRDCHPQERYQSIPKNCYACHKNDDKHEGRYSEECKKCHSPLAWSNTKFDHDKTDFKLTGRHVLLACEQCHRANVNAYKEDLKTDCYSCHKLNDRHKGLYGKKCQDCHTTKTWSKEKFDHDKTDFPLKGAHEKVACVDCHPGDLYKDKVSDKCVDCHQQNDVHAGQQGKLCQNCHNEKAWMNNVRFDHDITRFPLLGSHMTLACEECHGSTRFKDVKPQCGQCHKADDVHKQKLGPNCGACHFSQDWKVWDFDHDKRTKFKLRDAHKEKDCLLCHTKPVTGEIELSSACYGCHAADDAHDGGFGRVCSRCHNEKAFKEVNL